MVSVDSFINARKEWRDAVVLAWQKGEAVHFDAAKDFPMMQTRHRIVNGMWVFKPSN